MNILNYTTQIPVEKTVGEIQKMLAGAKAQAVMSEYDASGVLTTISFRVQCPYGLVTFRLPANVDKVFAVLVRSSKVPHRNRTREQAARVAWRIIKDWLAAQLALITAEMVTLEQLMLPYAQNEMGETVYEVLRSREFKGYALQAAKS